MIQGPTIYTFQTLVVCMLFSSHVHAVDLKSLDDLRGSWVSTDDAFGGSSVTTLDLVPIFGGKVYSLRYDINRNLEGSLSPLFSGIAHYKEQGDGAYIAYWADSNGDVLSIEAEIEGDTLTARWGSDETKQGITRYRLKDNGALLVTDQINREGAWVQFNELEFKRMAEQNTKTEDDRLISGIGGFFFRGGNPSVLSDWYHEHLGISPAPTSYEQIPWKQDAGFTVFSPFEQSTEYFGNPNSQWMINFRVRDLNRLIDQLRSKGIDVTDPEDHPNGRFARIVDPEGNPIELWEPSSHSVSSGEKE